MKPIKVNIDYENFLVDGKSNSPNLNEALEFLAFFLEQRPILSSKKYSASYLDYVASISGHRPILVREGNYENWWGELRDIELERKLNSKITSAEFNQGFTAVISKKEDLDKIIWPGEYLVKFPLSMSGQKFKIALMDDDLKGISFPYILEPLLNRKNDFSYYVFPDGKIICYENTVDRNFQYKGTIFHDYLNPTFENLSFATSVPAYILGEHKAELQRVVSYYRSIGATSGFSIDSFTFLRDGKLMIRTLSEVNYRKTMGMVCYELSLKYGKEYKGCSMTLSKNSGVLLADSKNIVLSPGDTRFDVLLSFF